MTDHPKARVLASTPHEGHPGTVDVTVACPFCGGDHEHGLAEPVPGERPPNDVRAAPCSGDLYEVVR